MSSSIPFPELFRDYVEYCDSKEALTERLRQRLDIVLDPYAFRPYVFVVPLGVFTPEDIDVVNSDLVYHNAESIAVVGVELYTAHHYAPFPLYRLVAPNFPKAQMDMWYHNVDMKRVHSVQFLTGVM